jgi:acyl-CoA oxidase
MYLCIRSPALACWSSRSASDGTVEAASPLDVERANPGFPVRQLTYYLDGGKDITKIRELVQASIEQDEILNDPHRFDLSREEARRRSMAKIKQVVGTIRSRNEDAAKDAASGTARPDEPTTEADRKSSESGVGRNFQEAFYSTLGRLDPSWAIRIGVHFGLFQGAINGSATDEQKAKLLKDVGEMRIIGCFAMTEVRKRTNKRPPAFAP